MITEFVFSVELIFWVIFKFITELIGLEWWVSLMVYFKILLHTQGVIVFPSGQYFIIPYLYYKLKAINKLDFFFLHTVHHFFCTMPDTLLLSHFFFVMASRESSGVSSLPNNLKMSFQIRRDFYLSVNVQISSLAPHVIYSIISSQLYPQKQTGI